MVHWSVKRAENTTNSGKWRVVPAIMTYANTTLESAYDCCDIGCGAGDEMPNGG
jgi:hypothetical protein